jgi:hypothetical protein
LLEEHATGALNESNHFASYMRKTLMLLLSGAVAIGACDSGNAKNASSVNVETATTEAKNVKPGLGRCHEDLCSWSITKSRTVVKQDALGTLIRLSVLGGTSKNTDGDYEKARIRWNSKPHEIYVFCSKRLPAVIMKMNLPPEAIKAAGGYKFPPYQVDVLDFVNGIPGNLESSANIFVRTCYPNDNWDTPGFAQRHGLTAFDELPDVTINNPEAIFQAADQTIAR